MNIYSFYKKTLKNSMQPVIQLVVLLTVLRDACVINFRGWKFAHNISSVFQSSVWALSLKEMFPEIHSITMKQNRRNIFKTLSCKVQQKNMKKWDIWRREINIYSFESWRSFSRILICILKKNGFMWEKLQRISLHSEKLMKIS